MWSGRRSVSSGAHRRRQALRDRVAAPLALRRPFTGRLEPAHFGDRHRLIRCHLVTALRVTSGKALAARIADPVRAGVALEIGMQETKMVAGMNYLGH